MTPADLADLFRHARERLGITRTQAADLLGRPLSNYSRLENHGLGLIETARVLSDLERLGVEICVAGPRRVLLRIPDSN